MLTLGCRCEGFKVKPKAKGTFICPANKTSLSTNTEINVRLCENLMSKSNGDKKNLIQYVDNGQKNGRNTNNSVKNIPNSNSGSGY